MGHRAELAERMPAMLLHEGIWEGTVRFVNVDGDETDRYQSRVECVFPDDGPYAYVQRNHNVWDDGRVVEIEFGGVLEGDRMIWNTERFKGYGWQTEDDILMLTLERIDVPDTSFTELILLGSDRDHRARTWHWFQNGRLFQRTLCDEHRVDR